MKVLFVIRSVNLFHYYKSIITALAKRGHVVEMLFDEKWSTAHSIEPVKEFIARYPACTYGWSLRRHGWLKPCIFQVRELRSYRRFLIVPGQSTYYRDRWPNHMPWLWRQTLKRVPGAKAILKTKLCGRFLAFIEDSVRPDPRIVEDIRKHAPDIAVVTPLNLRLSEDIEYLKAARSLKIPTAGAVLSWDNLTTKGLMSILPDILLVWNEAQVEEARVHHQIPPEKTRVVGAAVFDQWFDSNLSASADREVFCTAHGLDPKKPYVLYLGSSRNMAYDETWIIKKLRTALDESDDPLLRAVQLVVRPHGANYAIYKDIETPGIVLVPREGTLPNTRETLQLFYDTAYHSVGVIIGANTSAIIDSMTVGKPAIVFQTDQYRKTQMDTQHFRQLLEMEVPYLVPDTVSFLKRMFSLLKGDDPKRENRHAFIKRYIRPHDVSAGEKAADILEGLAKKRAR